MIITEHAARRFVQRLSPSTFLPDARALLRRASRAAVRLPDRTYKGQQLWRTTDDEAAGALLVVKHDAAVGLVVVTVLAAAEVVEGEGGEDEVRAAFERASLAKEEQRRICEAERAAVLAVPMRMPPAVRAQRAAKPVGKNKARRLAHEARVAVDQAAAAARKVERRAAHEARCVADLAAKAERERIRFAAERRENSAVYWAMWSGVLP